MTIPPNVKRGAAFLDEHLPNWRRVVDRERLDLGSSCDCLLGQMFGSFEDAVVVLDLDDKDAGWFGFYKYGRQTWDALTAGWRRELERPPA